MNKCPNCTDGYVQDTGFTECNYCNSAKQSMKKAPHKTYDYNLFIIDTRNAVHLLEILKDYGRDGWRFVGWTEMKIEEGFLRGAILEKENDPNLL